MPDDPGPAAGLVNAMPASDASIPLPTPVVGLRLLPLAGAGRDRRRRVVALAAAFALHALILAALILGPRDRAPPAPPPPIPVEIAVLPPPKPRMPPPLPAKAAPPQPPVIRQSGGDSDKKAGEAPAEPAPRKLEPAEAPAATPPRPVEVAKQPSPGLPAERSPAAEVPLPVAPPSPPPKPERSLAALPPSQHPPPQRPRESDLRGEGGGDRYLNAMRDQILANLIYPAAAREVGAAGVATYELAVDRTGRLMEAHLLRSSGFYALDQAGLNAIELSTPFRPLPAELGGPVVRMVLTLYMGQ
jgi:protein TonB